MREARLRNARKMFACRCTQEFSEQFLLEVVRVTPAAELRKFGQSELS